MRLRLLALEGERPIAGAASGCSDKWVGRSCGKDWCTAAVGVFAVGAAADVGLELVSGGARENSRP